MPQPLSQPLPRLPSVLPLTPSGYAAPDAPELHYWSPATAAFWTYPQLLPPGPTTALLGDVGRARLPARDLVECWQGKALDGVPPPPPPARLSIVPEALVLDLLGASLVRARPRTCSPTGTLSLLLCLTGPAAARRAEPPRVKPRVLWNGKPCNHALRHVTMRDPTPVAMVNTYELHRMGLRTVDGRPFLQRRPIRLWFQKSDAKNCYWSYQLPEQYASLFTFDAMLRGSLQQFEYLVLPFGWAGAPGCVQARHKRIATQVIRDLCLVDQVVVLVQVDDFLTIGLTYNSCLRVTVEIRRRLKHDGLVLAPDKNPDAPVPDEIPWIGKLWRLGIDISITATGPDYFDQAVSLLTGGHTGPHTSYYLCSLRNLSRALGLLCWYSAPTGALLPFAGPLYRMLADNSTDCATADSTVQLRIPYRYIDLLMRAMDAMGAMADVAPRSLEHSSIPSGIRQAMQHGVDRHGHGQFAISGCLLIYVDYASINQLGAVISVTPEGEVWAKQIYVTGWRWNPTDQQDGELGTLTQAVFFASCQGAGSGDNTVRYRFVFGDNTAALHSVLHIKTSSASPNRAYWMRRLTMNLGRLPPSALPAYFCGHLEGASGVGGADTVSRDDFVYRDWTLVQRVPILSPQHWA